MPSEVFFAHRFNSTDGSEPRSFLRDWNFGIYKDKTFHSPRGGEELEESSFGIRVHVNWVVSKFALRSQQSFLRVGTQKAQDTAEAGNIRRNKHAE